VILAIGVVPDSRLAQMAGLRTTDRAAIIVDDHQRTSDPDIYAVGDSVEVTDTVTGQQTVVPLAGPANRQGRIAADHMFGRDARYTTTQGTAIVKVFDLTAGGTGANEKSLRRAGMDYRKVYVHPNGHASYYPGTAAMHLKLLFSPEGRVLGGQVVGYDGVDKRIDVLAVAVRAGLTVWDLAELELAYAPPYGSAKDPINMAGFPGCQSPRWHHRVLVSARLGDAARGRRRARRPHARGEPVLRASLFAEHPCPATARAARRTRPSRPVYVYCRSGFRSYLAYRILKGSGFQQVATLSGGTMTMEHAVPWLRAEFELPTPVVTYAEDDRGCVLRFWTRYRSDLLALTGYGCSITTTLACPAAPLRIWRAAHNPKAAAISRPMPMTRTSTVTVAFGQAMTSTARTSCRMPKKR
jgi:hypothetical protein